MRQSVILRTLFAIYFIVTVISSAMAVDDVVPPDELTTTESPVDTRIGPAYQVGIESNNSASSLGADPILNSINVVDFVVLAEKEYQAEFVIDLIQEMKDMKPEEVTPIKLIKFRSLEILSENTLPDFKNPGQCKILKRIKATVRCKPFLTFYPWDVHACPLILFPGGKNGTPGGPWKDQIAPEQMPLCPGGMEAYEFRVKGYNPKMIPIGGGNSTGPGGLNMFSVTMLLERTSSSQIMSQIYSPIASLVLLSFFTMSWGSHTFRIGMSLACFMAILITCPMFWWLIPRKNEGQTATEHYLVICVGFAFQVVFVNVYAYKYLVTKRPKKQTSSSKQNGDIETPDENKIGENGKISELSISERPLSPSVTEKIKKLKLKPKEMHILELGGFHQFIYFKCVRSAWIQVPIFFTIVNIIFAIVILWFTSGLPENFLSVPKPVSELDMICL